MARTRSKTVVGIVGSPRRDGNTQVLVSEILAGARAAGATAESVFLADLTIRECDGCHACWRGAECSKADDMNALYPRLADSDVIVFGTPVYWYAPTALMKAFLDRFVYFNCSRHRPEVRGKRAILAVPFEETDPQAAALLVAIFEKSLAYLEMELTDTLLAPGAGRRGEVRDRPDLLARAREIGAGAAR
jgi:multimeric flavodoxin WrbA